MSEEVWVDIKGYENHYRVSNLGRVMSVARLYTRVLHGRPVTQRVSPRILSHGMVAGYQSVNLSKGGITKVAYVHHLVAEAFIGARPEHMQVCHKDGRKENNKSSNLRYDTPVGNAADRVPHETHAIGEANPMAKLTEDLVKDVYEKMKTRSAIDVAKETGVPRTTLSSIKNGYTWSTVTGEKRKRSGQSGRCQ